MEKLQFMDGYYYSHVVNSFHWDLIIVYTVCTFIYLFVGIDSFIYEFILKPVVYIFHVDKYFYDSFTFKWYFYVNIFIKKISFAITNGKD